MMKNKIRLSLDGWLTITTSLVSVVFLTLFALQAGGLWRDEANTFNLAELSYGELWFKMQYDSFPLIWPVVFGFLQKVGFQGDLSLRFLGVFILLLLLGCLWYNACRLNYKSPLIAVTLLMLSPSLIIWGSSIRAWGFGMVFSSLIYTFTIGYVLKPNIRNWILLLIICLLGIHTLYYNTIVVFVCLSSGSLCLYVAGHKKESVLTLLIGVLTAASMTVYITTINRIAEWNLSVKTNFDLQLFIAKIYETLSPGGTLALFAWALAVPVCLVLAAWYLIKTYKNGKPSDESQLLFSFLVLMLIVPVYYLFLTKVSYLTQPWYYFVLMLIVAIATDTILGTLSRIPSVNNARIFAAGLLLVAALSVNPSVIFMRLTNIDLLSAILNKDAKQQDLILVYPWFEGITFDRYYGGEAPWYTIPSLSDHKLHRYDLVKEHMKNPVQADVLRSTYWDMEKTLRSGNTVYLVGEPMFPQAGQTVPVLPPAPLSPWGWQDGPYCIIWSMQISDYLLKHSAYKTQFQHDQSMKINPHENANLYVFKGWKD
jgi:hypothetical protein